MAIGNLANGVRTLVDSLGALVGFAGPAQDFGAVVALGQNHVAFTTPLDTNENVAFSLVIPAGLMGPNDTLRVHYKATMTNNANAKTFIVKLGGTTFSSAPLPSVASTMPTVTISNRGSVASQIGSVNGTDRTFGTTSALTTGTVNMANAQTLTVSATKGTGTDSIVIESVMVELVRGA